MVEFDALSYPYPSRRSVTYARNGMMAASQPLAAQAGLEILQKGGNAIDAAVATAACLTVLEPTSNGIGGDAFALVWSKGKLYGLNASGPAPQKISIDALRKAGYTEIPKFGWIPVTVPGAPAAWAALSKRFGKLPFGEVLAPAIRYGEQGYPVSPVLAHYWEKAFRDYVRELQGEEFVEWFKTFAPEGRAPRPGELWRSPDHARTLVKIAETKGEAFYRGEIAEKIAQFANRYGGFLTFDDLAAFQPEWVEPISVRYRGYDVWEIPPNGQGLVALLALNILKGFDFPCKESIETYHTQLEAMKLAFADGLRYITERSKMTVKAEDLLSDAYAEERRKLISRQAQAPASGKPPRGGTVYLAAADGEGNMVSFIQSNYMGFGSGLVVPGTGISLHNRGHTFSLDPAHANRLEPGKRTYHTIIPGFLSKDGEPVGPFGVMGAFMQPQGHVQVIMNTIDFHLNPQAALDAPRWQWTEKKTVFVERGIPDHIVQELARRGHDVRIAADPAGFGRGQIIWRDPRTGVLAGGTEPRTDGAVAAW
ncbi:gamma-glutamyltransferase family protein [Bacillaceae bacterium]